MKRNFYMKDKEVGSLKEFVNVYNHNMDVLGVISKKYGKKLKTLKRLIILLDIGLVIQEIRLCKLEKRVVELENQEDCMKGE